MNGDKIPSPSNPYYFKSHIVSFYYALLMIIGLGIIIYNVINRRICKKYTSKTALIINGSLGIPIIVDSMYDIITKFKADNFSPAALITLMVIMFILSILAIIFFVQTAKKCSPVISCKKNGYEMLRSTKNIKK